MIVQRRSFLTLLGGATAVWPRGARAQQPSAIKRIGWISPTVAEQDPLAQAQERAFLEGLVKLGWKEGANVRVDRRTDSGGDASRRRLMSAELVRTAPDVILCSGTVQTAIFQQLTNTIPIVFVNVAEPVASGFVASFARPGGNITGFTSVESSFAGKWLSILKDIAPAIVRVLALYNPDNANWTGYLPTIEAAAASLRVNVSAARVVTAADVERSIETFAGEPGSGIIVIPAVMITNREMLAALAARHRLPAIYPYDIYAESGGLVSYGSNYLDLYRQAAGYVDRILRGTKPADLPVQAPVKFELVINLKAAKAIGIEVPYNVLLLADRVID
jgi:putative ABC transport system substrate-binding protein